MNKQIIYTTKDKQDFQVSPYIPTAYSSAGKEKTMVLTIANGYNTLYFLDKYEVDEFCKILQIIFRSLGSFANSLNVFSNNSIFKILS